MKKMILVLASLFMSSYAFAECPKGATQILSCQSAPRAGDSKVAASSFDSIGVCRDSKNAWLIVEKNGQSETVQASVIDRSGASTYTVSAGDVEFQFQVIIGFIHNMDTIATLKMIFHGADGLEASSTYNCTR